MFQVEYIYKLAILRGKAEATSYIFYIIFQFFGHRPLRRAKGTPLEHFSSFCSLGSNPRLNDFTRAGTPSRL